VCVCVCEHASAYPQPYTLKLNRALKGLPDFELRLQPVALGLNPDPKPGLNPA